MNNRFDHVPLNRKLSFEFLDSLSLDELEQLKNNLIGRAAAVFGEIGELKAIDPNSRKQYQRRMFRCEIETPAGELVFRYECEPRLKEYQVFVPGAWFDVHLLELEQLRSKKEEIIVSLPDLKREKLISQLLGSRPKTKSKSEIVNNPSAPKIAKVEALNF